MQLKTGRPRAALVTAMLVGAATFITVITLVLVWQRRRRHQSQSRTASFTTTPLLVKEDASESRCTPSTVFTCTTWFDAPVGGKWDAFCTGMHSLLTHHGEATNTLIDAWLVVNEPRRPGSPDWTALVAEKFPWVTFVQKTEEQKGQACSLNLILKEIKPFRFWLQWEEAWFCTRPFLHDALAVMQANPSITQLQLTHRPSQTDPDWYHQRQRGQDDQGWAYIPSNPETFHALTIKNTDYSVWPVYSLRPSLNAVPFYATLPQFSEAPDMWPLKFEWDYARNWVLAGGVKAILLKAPVTRSSKHVSTYKNTK